jgi:hypothetical protein
MSFARDRDLERWEQGELSMSDLVALHGSDGAAGMVVLHRRMSALRTSPVGDPETVWRAISERLPTAGGQRQTAPFRRRLTRPLAIAAAAVLIAGTAYAGSPSAVQRYLTSFWHSVQSILDVDVPGNAPADADRPPHGAGQGDEPAAGVGDADHEDPNGEERNEDEEAGDSSTVGDDAEDRRTDEDENGSGDGEGIGENDQGDDQDDDADRVEDDGDETADDGDGSAVDQDDPSDDQIDPGGSGGSDDEATPGGSGGGDGQDD